MAFSLDQVMYVTESGRLTKTVNLKSGNLLATYSEKTDPLILGLEKSTTPMQWTRHIDVTPEQYFGLTLESTFVKKGKTVKTINNRNYETILYIENVSIPELKMQYKNQFWLDTNTYKVIASHQKASPFMPHIELMNLKPFIEVF